MHARNRTWLLGSDPVERCRQRTLPVEGGDGSTLSLDFTTGVLDPRLTFTRTTNATFINSQGLVQWANANMLYNSVFSGGTTPPGWTLVAGGAGATTPSEGVRRMVTTTAAQNFFNSAALSTAIGTVYASTVNIREVNGQHYRNSFEITASPTILKYYRNGVEVASGTGEFITAQAGLVTVVWIATSATAHNVRVGVGCTGSNVANAVCEFENCHTTPVFFPGTTTATSPATYTAPAYVPNTNTGATYQAPRFDYDPSTLQPRGLLIEGSANNLCEQGQYCWGTGTTKIWVRSAGINVNSVNGSGGANIIARIDGPDGGSLTGTSVVKDAGLSFVRFNVDVTVAASTTYTFSAYVRAPSGGNPYMRLAAFNGGTWLATTGGTTASGITITDTANNGSRFNGVPSTAWVRVWVTFTTQAGQTAATIAFYPDTDTTSAATMYVWGAQVETGSGPSSLIPTGASTGSRALDSCYIAGTNFTSWFSTGAGTVVAQSDNVCTVGQNTLCNFSDSSTNNMIRMGDGVLGGTNELLWTNVGGVTQASADSGFNPALNTAYKTAYAWDTNNFAICANGGAVTTDTSGTLAGAGVITSVTIGGDFYQTAGPNSFSMKNGHIRSWKYYPTRLTNAQLQALTT